MAVSKRKSSKKESKAKSKAAAAPRKVAAKSKSAAIPTEDWRENTLARMRDLILEADPGISEEQKWKKPMNPTGVPLWSHNGMICTGEIYKSYVKLTFAYGASLPDPAHLFNASLDAGTRRAIDIREGDKVDPRAFKALVKAAVAFNSMKKQR
ncbi:MAG TPA: DUF1801 domain-containing protein [Candidatus Krumholzibacteria bacterium]|nr:DUF1801 domain-containing protein [Candidatus Krumholzibacteria bacterium]